MAVDMSVAFASTDAVVQLEAVYRIFFAALLGALLGLERSIAGKHAGMRTYALVSVGSSLFIVIENIASVLLSPFTGINPLALGASVIVGIGFIGAGLSYSRNGSVHIELTTASGIWLSAGIGMACGFGLYTIAVASTIVGLLIFSLLLRLENVLRQHYTHSEEEH